MKKIIFQIFLGVMFIQSCKPGYPSATGDKNTGSGSLHPEASIQRIVCFKFKEGTSQEAISQHMRGFSNLKDSISYILTYQAGPTVNGDLTGKQEYDVMHYTTYRNEEEIRKYSDHPVHQRFIKQNKAIWEKVLVLNSRIRP